MDSTENKISLPKTSTPSLTATKVMKTAMEEMTVLTWALTFLLTLISMLKNEKRSGTEPGSWRN